MQHTRIFVICLFWVDIKATWFFEKQLWKICVDTTLFFFFIQLTPTASYSEEVVDALQKLGFPLNEELLKWSVSRHIFGP